MINRRGSYNRGLVAPASRPPAPARSHRGFRPPGAARRRAGSASFDALAQQAEEARAAGPPRRGGRRSTGGPRGAAGLGRRPVGPRYDRLRAGPVRRLPGRVRAARRAAAEWRPAWALRGLCEFRTASSRRGRAHLAKGLSLGLPPREDLGRAALYHQALLLVREGAVRRSPSRPSARSCSSSRRRPSWSSPAASSCCAARCCRRPSRRRSAALVAEAGRRLLRPPRAPPGAKPCAGSAS